MKNILFALSLIVFITAQSFTSATDDAEMGYDVGDVIQDFSLKNVDGEMMSLADMEEAKGFIVVFTCNHCPYSVMYEDRLIGIDQMYAAQGYPVIAINPNDEVRKPEDSFENMIIRAREKEFTFPYLHDETQDIARQFGATKTPHVYIVIKEEAGLVVKYIGAIDDSPRSSDEIEDPYLHKAMRSIVSGIAPDPDYTKAIGCTIKWAE